VLRLHDTLTRKKCLLRPLVPGRVGIYTCGPTLHAFAHLGLIRRLLAVDILKRLLAHEGYQVRHVMNLTDIDDKTIAESARRGVSLGELTGEYAREFFDDVAALRMFPADHCPRATEHVDDMAFIHSCYTKTNNHSPALFEINTGMSRMGFPCMGAWVTYGLGTENQNLPGYVAMCPGGVPIVGIQNWRSAFLPGAFQGTYIDTQHADDARLIENIRNDAETPEGQRRQLDLMRRLNELHAAERPHDPALEARIQSFELAYRMQSEAAEAFDIVRAPEPIRALYGPGTQARQLLITRRLLERGVRFIQVWSGASQP